MKQQKKKKSIILEHMGDHHQVQAVVEDGKIKRGGMVYNFDEGMAMALTADNKGRLGGTFMHTGDTHRLLLNLKNDGTYAGQYFDKKLGLGVAIKKGKGAAAPTVKLKHAKGDHHATELSIDGKGNVSGRVKLKLNNNWSSGLSFNKGKVTGEIIHKGKGHETRFKLSSDGKYKLSYTNKGPKGANFTLGLKNGEPFAKLGAGFEF